MRGIRVLRYSFQLFPLVLPTHFGDCFALLQTTHYISMPMDTMLTTSPSAALVLKIGPSTTGLSDGATGAIWAFAKGKSLVTLAVAARFGLNKAECNAAASPFHPPATDEHVDKHADDHGRRKLLVEGLRNLRRIFAGDVFALLADRVRLSCNVPASLLSAYSALVPTARSPVVSDWHSCLAVVPEPWFSSIIDYRLSEKRNKDVVVVVDYD